MDRFKKNAFLFLALLHALAWKTASAKKYGGGGGGGGSLGKGVGSGGGGGKISTGTAATPSGSMQPVRTNGAGYANSGKFAAASSSYGGRYSRYPNGGYRSSAWTFLFLHQMHYRSGRGRDDDDYERYFDRIENGCQLTDVASYRTIDNDGDDDSDASGSLNVSSSSGGDDDDDDWVGCTEEWTYSVAVVDDGNDGSDRVFVSPPVELYACDRNDTCAECQEELRGADFDALALEAMDFSGESSDPYVDCFVPKNLTQVN